MRVLSAREAAIFAELTDAVTAPHPPLPPVAETDAVLAFDRMLVLAPRQNRAALRAALHALDVVPLALGFRRRLRSLSRQERLRVLYALERLPVAGRLAEALRAAASVAYFGDRRNLSLLGYDADAVVARGKELRRLEQRP